MNLSTSVEVVLCERPLVIPLRVPLPYTYDPFPPRLVTEGEELEDKWLDGITNAMDVNLGKLRGMVTDREAWPAAVHGIARNWM